MTVTGKGSYTGKITKTFKINPQGQSISAKGDKSGKKIAVTLAKHSSNSGYQVSYADNSGFKNSKSLWLSGNSKNKGTIKGLKSKRHITSRQGIIRQLARPKCTASGRL